MYGVVKPNPPGGVFGIARAVANRLAGDEVATYFECYGCQARRRRKRILLYTLLVALVAVAWLFSAIGSGTLRLPWRE
jgi:hypothetical protein